MTGAAPIRTFIAFDLPTEGKEALGTLINELRQQGLEGLRWVRPQGVHLTLKFLGDIDPELVPQVDAAIRRAAQEVGPFQLTLSGVGVFPNREAPRVVWVGVDGDLDALRGLQNRVENEIEPLGFPRDRRGFNAHLTLARVRGRVLTAQRRQLTSALDNPAAVPQFQWQAAEVILVHSTLTPDGAVYRNLAAVPWPTGDIIASHPPTGGHPMQRRTSTITPRPPYDFGLTMEYLASFQGELRVNVMEDAHYRRLFEVNGSLLLAGVRSVGTVERPELDITVEGESVSDAEFHAVSQALEWTLISTVPLDQFYALVSQDQVLAPVVQHLYGLHPTRTPTLFEAFVQAIMGQQIASSVARIIRAALLESYSPTFSVNGRTYYAFPSPEQIMSQGIPGLRGVKLSNRKAEYILDVATVLQRGDLDLEALRDLPDEAVAERLLALRGVGRWTVEWLLIQGLGRLNGFPSGDLALQRVIARFYFETERLTEQELEQFSQRWAPWRSLFTTYLFAAIRKGMIKP